MENQARKPDEVDSFEYLAEHLYEWAHKNPELADAFEGLKVILPYLKRYANLSKVLDRIAKGNQRLRNRLGKDLIRLYMPEPGLGQTTMELLLLVLWPDLIALYETLPESAFDGEPFAEIYWRVFEILNDEPTKGAIATLDDLINELKERI